MSRIYRREEIWWMDYRDPHGRRVRESSGTNSKTEAQAILASLTTKVREGKFFDISQARNLKFKELLAQVHEHQKKIGRRSYETYFCTYAKHLQAHFGEKYVEEISPKLVQEYQFERVKMVSYATANRSLAVLKMVFNLGIKWGLLKSNPVKQVEFFKEPKGRLRFLDKAEQEALLKASQPSIRDVVLVALRTGMRSGELAGIRRKDVDFEKGFIFLEKTKSGEPRQVPMVPEVRAVLARLSLGAGPEDQLFKSQKGKPYKNWRTGFLSAMRQARIEKFRFHDLRHTFASDFMMSGGNVFTLSKILGHADISTTMIYSHLSPEHHRVEMQRFQNYLAERDGTKMAQQAS